MPGAYLEFAERLATPQFAHLPVRAEGGAKLTQPPVCNVMMLTMQHIRVA